jgi:hypothetical protein
MKKPKFKINDWVNFRVHKLKQRFNSRFLELIFPNMDQQQPFGQIIDMHITREEPNKITFTYRVRVENSPELRWWEEDELEHRITLTSETDKVFRDIIRDI